MSERIAVKFTKSYNPYHGNDVASFTSDRADVLVKLGVAEIVPVKVVTEEVVVTEPVAVAEEVVEQAIEEVVADVNAPVVKPAKAKRK